MKWKHHPHDRVHWNLPSGVHDLTVSEMALIDPKHMPSVFSSDSIQSS